MKKLRHAIVNKLKQEVAILTPDKIDLRPKKIAKDKETYYIWYKD